MDNNYNDFDVDWQIRIIFNGVGRGEGWVCSIMH